MTNDRVLIAEILAGNQAAFQTFVSAYQKLVAHVVFRMVKNDCDREDLCQDVFLKAYRNLDGFQFACKVSTWLARIAHNTCMNYIEKKKVPLLSDLRPDTGRDPIDEIPRQGRSPEQFAEGRDLDQRIRDEVDLLPPQYGILVVLYHLEQMSYEEIADITSQPLGTVKSYLYRARKMLKESLLEKYELEDILQ
ncbi:MAG: sigma-70 family RNA polymerase sigma factor [candidate division Zixibacteria bacterium]|nr:sigma-70 family RNA polymerase sigma factor [candidate division Zixibacteria bacterium]